MSAQGKKASYIIAAAREVDGVGSLAPVEAQWNALREKGAQLRVLVIDPLEAGWNTPLLPDHFRSGCAPIEALERADQLIREGDIDAVLIRGEDLLRSHYRHDKARRQRLMAIYGDELSIPEAYTQLASAFSLRRGISQEEFKELAQALFENYRRTAHRAGNDQPPRSEALSTATSLFRIVDCANPNVDFKGAVIVASASCVKRPGIEILGVGLTEIAGDGPQWIEKIASYDHLRAACQTAYKRAGVDYAAEFQDGRALLEAYTCFPVVPLALLLASGIVNRIEDIMPLLSQREITVTGGMNLAHAPWNNPALNALIVMYQRLKTGPSILGAVHGNGGLGYKQGFAILRRGIAP